MTTVTLSSLLFIGKSQLSSKAAIAAADGDYVLPNNCYAEKHVKGLYLPRVVSTRACRDIGVNTVDVLTPDEQSVLDELDRRVALWNQQRSDGSDADGALVPRGEGEVPFTAEVQVTALVDALWKARHRPRAVQALEVKYQRAALIAAKRNRQANGSTRDLLLASPSSCGSPTTSSSLPVMPSLLLPASSQALSALVPRQLMERPDSATSGGGFLNNSSFASGSSSPVSTFRQAFPGVSAEDQIPTLFPIDRNFLQAVAKPSSPIETLTNVSLRALSLARTYVGSEHCLQCVMDLILLCPNVTAVSFAGHHMSSESMSHLIRIVGSGGHPCLASVDIRGNVIEVPILKKWFAALRSNCRVTEFLVDKDCRLLAASEQKLQAIVEENRMKMRTVSKMRSEWTQTTLLPQELPADVKAFLL